MSRRPALIPPVLAGLLFAAAVSGVLAARPPAEELPAIGSLAVPFVIIIILVLLNALFVAAEFAIIGVRPTQLKQMAEAGNRTAANVLAILRSPSGQDRYIATAQLGITIASLGLGMYGEPHIAHFIEPYIARLIGRDPHAAVVQSAGYLIAIGLLTYLHTVIGEMVPKSLALSSRMRTALAIYLPMSLSQAVFHIPVTILNGIGNALLRLLRIPPAAAHARLHSAEELELIVEESAEVGLLEKRQEEFIQGIFDFGERRVNQVMTPRMKIQAIPCDASVAEIQGVLKDSYHSRFPVYEGNLDNIVGTLLLKDFVRQELRRKGSFDIRLLLRPAVVVPERWPVEKLLLTFKRLRSSMAVVLDEYGGTAGIVTLEDLVEEVVGDVRDEFDRESEPLIQTAPGVLEVQGTFLLDDLREYVDLGREQDLPEVETVGGLIMAQLGRLPREGDRASYGNRVTITVLETDGFAVARARIEFSAGDIQRGGLQK